MLAVKKEESGGRSPSLAVWPHLSALHIPKGGVSVVRKRGIRVNLKCWYGPRV